MKRKVLLSLFKLSCTIGSSSCTSGKAKLTPKAVHSAMIMSLSTSNTSNKESKQQRFISLPKNLKGLFVGSGSDGMNEPQITDAIFNLATSSTKEKVLNVLYLGTATYDLPGPKMKQTEKFRESSSCNVQFLDVANTILLQDEIENKSNMEEMIRQADIIIVSGGNTLYAVDRWQQLGLDKLLYNAMHRGAVLTGGSAGAICWFDGGHSDSMDPDSYKSAMQQQEQQLGEDESSKAPTSSEEVKKWDYIRVPGLGFLPALICPHHDKIQSNGLLRATDFDELLLRHPTEIGIGIDHFAALEVNGDQYRVVSVKGKKGSVLSSASSDDDQHLFSPDRKGRAGIWIKQVVMEKEEGGGMKKKIVTRLCPETGNLRDILCIPSEILQDPRVEICRKENPTPNDF